MRIWKHLSENLWNGREYFMYFVKNRMMQRKTKEKNQERIGSEDRNEEGEYYLCPVNSMRFW